MNVLIIADHQWGKDTVCDILAKYGITSDSSSMFAARTFLFDKLKDKYNYLSVEECYADRGNHRTEWFTEISAFNDGHLTRLAEGILANCNIYNGMRNRREFTACDKAGIFDLKVWVDASERCEPEPVASMQLNRGDAEFIIDNNGAEHLLEAQVLELARIINPGFVRDFQLKATG